VKAVVWHGKEDVRVDNVPDPTIEKPTDAIVRITSTAICGSDLHLYAKLGPAMKEGDIIGHEPMGVVEEVGSDVKPIAPGDKVVVPFNISCGTCWMCRRNLFSQCETTQNHETGKGASLLGYTHLYGGVPGGQAEYLRVPMAHFGPIKIEQDGAPDTRFLFLSDVLPTAWQAVEYAEIEPGETVGVWGLGPVGQMAARIALHRGAGQVLGIDQVPERLAMAQRHGVETIDFGAVDDIVELVRDLTRGRGVDRAIDAVGMEAEGSPVSRFLQATKLVPDRLQALWQSGRSVRRGGTISLVGVYAGAVPLAPIGEMFDRQLTVTMGQANVKRWVPELMPLLTDEDPLGVDDLTTHEVPLDQAPQMYEKFQKKEDGCIKVVLRP
jgi:threonine dehydrogenase-like Zn-dependent dehydrogenase